MQTPDQKITKLVNEITDQLTFQAGLPLILLRVAFYVAWDPEAAVTPMGQQPFFIEFLKASGCCDAFVADCPLHYTSPNARKVRDVLGTLTLSILAGRKRCARITTIGSDRGSRELPGMGNAVSEGTRCN